jgi:hypothetical protein
MPEGRALGGTAGVAGACETPTGHGVTIVDLPQLSRFYGVARDCIVARRALLAAAHCVASDQPGIALTGSSIALQGKGLDRAWRV